MGVPSSPSLVADMKINIILGFLVSAVLPDSISRIDRVPAFGARPLRQLARAALQPQPRGLRQISNPILDLLQLIDPSSGDSKDLAFDFEDEFASTPSMSTPGQRRPPGGALKGSAR